MALTDYTNIEHDLVISPEGDFAKSDMSQLHIQDILLITRGSFRLNPLIGVDLIHYVNAPWSRKVQLKLEKTIRLQLTADGYTIHRIDATDLSNIIIDATK